MVRHTLKILQHLLQGFSKGLFDDDVNVLFRGMNEKGKSWKQSFQQMQLGNYPHYKPRHDVRENRIVIAEITE